MTLTRAPLLVPLTAMQGNLIAISWMPVRTGCGPWHRPWRCSRSSGAAGITLAALTGPWLLRRFRRAVPRLRCAAGLAHGGAVVIAVLTITGAAAVAAALHRAYSLGWVCATVAAAALLLLPLALETRTVVALVCGPLVGIACTWPRWGRG